VAGVLVWGLGLFSAFSCWCWYCCLHPWVLWEAWALASGRTQRHREYTAAPPLPVAPPFLTERRWVRRAVFLPEVSVLSLKTTVLRDEDTRRQLR
ncbi:hypothetical protein XENTR_v10024746, partial [Xenopus tropicalis]